MNDMFRTVGLYLALFLCWSLRMEAQNIKVESFSRVDNDITARVNVVKDANDDECALIKMMTTDANYNVDEGLKRESRVGEIWFYVPQGTKRIVIRHQKLGKLVYDLPESLKGKTTYQIKLPDNVEIIVHEDVGGQYLVMDVQPTDAAVYIDGSLEVLTNGTLSKLLKYGRHTYKVEASLYQPEEGEVEVNKERRKMSIQLKPDFGFMQINSIPEENATVYLDGTLVGKTPLRTGKLSKGIHHIKALLPMFQPLESTVEVVAGQTSAANLKFIPNFANIDLRVTADEEIWVNNEFKGKGSWSGRLIPGLYTFEARKNAYRSFKKSIELKAGESKNITLDSPSPLYGSLNVNTNPVDAKVFIDGKEIGLTPNVFNNILIGKRKVVISKSGCLTKVVEVDVKEGIVENINVSLPVGRNIIIMSNLKDAKIYVDQKLLGESPVSTSLTYATHTIVAKSPTKTLTRTITVNSETSGILLLNDLMLGEALGGGWYEAGYLNLQRTGQIGSPAGYGYMSLGRKGCVVGHKLYLLYKTYGQKIMQNGGRAHIFEVKSLEEYDLETGKCTVLEGGRIPFSGDYKLGLYNGKMIAFSSDEKKAYVYEDGWFSSFPYNINMREVSNAVTDAVSENFHRNVGRSCTEIFRGKGFDVVATEYSCYLYIPSGK